MRFVPEIDFESFLPAELGDMTQLIERAKTLKKSADKVRNKHSDTAAKWSGLHATVDYTGSGDLHGAFRNNTAHFKSEIDRGVTGISTALTTFATRVSPFKTGTHATLKADVAAFNALHENQYSALDREMAVEDGNSLPTNTRTYEKRTLLLNQLNNARRDYEGWVDDCAGAIGKSVGASSTWARELNTYVQGGKKAWDLAKTNAGHLANLRSFNNMVAYTWKTEFWSTATHINKGLPAWTKLFPGMEKWVYKTFGHKGKLPRFEKGVKTNWAGLSWERTSYKHLKGDPKVYYTGQAVTNVKASASMKSWMRKFDQASEKMSAIAKNPYFKAGTRALRVIDVGVTYYDSYQKNYNEALRRNPAMTGEQARNEAITSAAIEGTAKTAGKAAGAIVGRAAGAALGQTFIPVPVVGAAIGGFVGGIVGEKVGGFVGEKVGGFVNDVRRDGVRAAASKAVEAAGDTVVGGLKSFGGGVVSVGKKILGWGW